MAERRARVGGPAARILVVDDDVLLRKLVRYVLQEAGYDVAAVDGAAAALRVMEREDVHLIILDVTMPGMNGLEFCRRVRAQRADVPILFLSGQQDVNDTVAGFDAGGDDYLAKPFEPRELLARARALLNRQLWGAASVGGTTLKAGGLTLDLAKLSVQLPDSRVVALSPTEVHLLQYLMANAGRVVTRDLILQAVWGHDFESESNLVDVYIRRLRRKLEAHPSRRLIETVRGMGYRLVAVAPPGTSRA